MGVPHSLGYLAWGCQIWGGAKSTVTPVSRPTHFFSKKAKKKKGGGGGAWFSDG